LHSEVTGDLINVKYGYGRIDSCIFRGNDQVDTDAIDYDEVENGIIRNSKMYDFFGPNSDGIDLGEESIDALIENNLISNCSDKGISVGQESRIIARNNTIVNCNLGVAVKDQSFAQVDQHTFYNTAIPMACYEKNPGIGGGMGILTNSILSNAAESLYLTDEYSSLLMENNLSDTDSLPGINNSFGNPEFENPTFFDFHLKTSSPAIQAGTDSMGNSIDLGTKSFMYEAIPSVMISGINYHPQENADAEYIEIYNPGSEPVDLEGYTLSGAVSLLFPKKILLPEKHLLIAKNDSFFSEPWLVLTWAEGRLSNGGERIRLSNAYGMIVDQVIYDNESPWPMAADGNGSALSLISPELDNHFASSWESVLPVSVEKGFANSRQATIYPNPTTGKVNIGLGGEWIGKIRMFNFWGQEVSIPGFTAGHEVQI
ncbi:MAG: lamin tail domain-containing protein, partial [Bacteroidetes bacterium]|nr:lamin tail domain-containing protein [Bacteroidota bacterium]